jgi:hypothetical protein
VKKPEDCKWHRDTKLKRSGGLVICDLSKIMGGIKEVMCPCKAWAEKEEEEITGLKDKGNLWFYCPKCSWRADAPNIGMPNKCPACRAPGLSYYSFDKYEEGAVKKMLSMLK